MHTGVVQYTEVCNPVHKGAIQYTRVQLRTERVAIQCIRLQFSTQRVANQYTRVKFHTQGCTPVIHKSKMFCSKKQPAVLDWPVKKDRKQDCTQLGHQKLENYH